MLFAYEWWPDFRAWLHERVVDRVHVLDERAHDSELVLGRRVQRQRHRTARVRAVMAEAVMQCLDGMADPRLTP
jgi:hypothetical protein